MLHPMIQICFSPDCRMQVCRRRPRRGEQQGKLRYFIVVIHKVPKLMKERDAEYWAMLECLRRTYSDQEGCITICVEFIQGPRDVRPKVRRVDDRLAGFERSIRDYSEVVDCWLMTGSFDYLLRVAVADLVEFETFLTGKLTKVPGVALIESSIPIRRVKTKLSRIS